jgi:hypothetical protein
MYYLGAMAKSMTGQARVEWVLLWLATVRSKCQSNKNVLLAVEVITYRSLIAVQRVGFSSNEVDYGLAKECFFKKS